jgi:hypothetical protein
MFKEIDYNKRILIGTPLVDWKCYKNEHEAWLINRHEIKNTFKNCEFFSAFEINKTGLDPFNSVIQKLNEINGKYWTYSINDNEKEIREINRLIRIETGRNLVREYAQRKRITKGGSWGEDCTSENNSVFNFDAILYVDSDMILTKQVIEGVISIDHPLVGCRTYYGLPPGKIINHNPLIEEHWTTAGLLLVNSPAYYDLPWYHNAYLNLSDDPSFQYMSSRLNEMKNDLTINQPYGMTWVRKDIYIDHVGQIGLLEHRNLPNRE